MYDTIKIVISIFLLTLLASCGGDGPVPKPDAQLALNYSSPIYKSLDKSLPYTFEFNEFAFAKANDDKSSSITYPELDAKIYLTYRAVDTNLRQLLIDGQKLSYNHNQMADAISETPFMNTQKSVYGMLYGVEGNAASNVQFYATDSTRHFLTAALYFDREPNYDSILPAVDYIKKDMIKMMESLEWR
ncbi:gliding motility protein GldD [Nonlabens sp. YIK11]|uniref:gliding motility lipoprotein GldD n=1 Tax=Nonlabens sp. YIK11 TaxID=1453349 RepID=UPI0006DC9AFF|nr:gliding motility lipoprotein GldD [Nonlabens sp. YIK11]KQC32236.1 gliding motility protein GldD [Nonlabens sp. YIK11]